MRTSDEVPSVEGLSPKWMRTCTHLYSNLTYCSVLLLTFVGSHLIMSVFDNDYQLEHFLPESDYFSMNDELKFSLKRQIFLVKLFYSEQSKLYSVSKQMTIFFVRYWLFELHVSFLSLKWKLSSIIDQENNENYH